MWNVRSAADGVATSYGRRVGAGCRQWQDRRDFPQALRRGLHARVTPWICIAGMSIAAVRECRAPRLLAACRRRVNAARLDKLPAMARL